MIFFKKLRCYTLYQNYNNNQFEDVLNTSYLYLKALIFYKRENMHIPFFYVLPSPVSHTLILPRRML